MGMGKPTAKMQQVADLHRRKSQEKAAMEDIANNVSANLNVQDQLQPLIDIRGSTRGGNLSPTNAKSGKFFPKLFGRQEVN